MLRRLLPLARRAAASAWWRSLPVRRATKRATRRLLVRLPLTGTVRRHYRVARNGTRDDPALPEVPVVMCTWQRVGRLRETLAMLEAQEDVRVRLFLWNNNRRERATLDALFATYRGVAVEVMHSVYNIGGFGRFYAARELAGRYPTVIFIDDDQTLPPNAIDCLRQEGGAMRVAACWAFNFGATPASRPGRYLDRRRTKPGAPATYCGTGGMVCPTWIFQQDRLFECPPKYWFIEDLWLSYLADHRWKMDLRGSHAGITLEKDDKDQVGSLLDLKDDFLHELAGTGGWDLRGA